MIIEFNLPAFREQFPAFADPVKFPDAVLQGYWDTATCFISPVDYGYLSGECRERAINLMTAHLAALSAMIQGSGGSSPGIAQSASIDKISVSMVAPTVKSEWEYWLMQTPWGLMLLALLRAKAAGGMYIGGSLERSAFRKVGGGFR